MFTSTCLYRCIIYDIITVWSQKVYKKTKMAYIKLTWVVDWLVCIEKNIIWSFVIDKKRRRIRINVKLGRRIW